MGAAWWQQSAWDIDIRRSATADRWEVYVLGYGEVVGVNEEGRLVFDAEADPSQPRPVLVITGVEAKTGFFRALGKAIEQAGLGAGEE